MRYVDAHMHLDLMEDPADYVRQAAAEGTGLFAATVTPEGFARISAAFGTQPHVRVGLGLHPWWVQEDSAVHLEHFMALMSSERYIGEVGLDLTPAHERSIVQQRYVLELVLRECARQGGKIVTLHCVRAYDDLLNLLRTTGVTCNNACILHWFSGTHDDLLAARDLGCWFSVGERLLSSKRGRAYVHTMPADRLLLETDAPPAGGGIAQAYRLLAQELGEAAARATTANGRELFGWSDQ